MYHTIKEKEKEDNIKTVDKISDGELFIRNSTLYLKTSRVEDNKIFCVLLMTGQIVPFYKHNEVIHIKKYVLEIEI